MLYRQTKIKLLRIVKGRTHIIFRNAKANRIFVKVYKSKREMKFFIDTANLEQIKEAQDLGILDGVTTNPSLMAKEGINGAEAIKQHYKTICEIVDGDISAGSSFYYL